MKKNVESYIFRQPVVEDVHEFTEYINTLSKEDTFITFSGEQVTEEKEREYLEKSLKDIKDGNKVMWCAFDEKKLIGGCDVKRETASKQRRLHVGIFGISVRKEYRGQGVGRKLASETVFLAKKKIPNLRIITLSVYQDNKKAQALYTSLGFCEYGRLKEGIFFHQSYGDEILMRLHIK